MLYFDDHTWNTKRREADGWVTYSAELGQLHYEGIGAPPIDFEIPYIDDGLVRWRLRAATGRIGPVRLRLHFRSDASHKLLADSRARDSKGAQTRWHGADYQ